ncbi:hypothetical protein BS47DRAFT_1402118 [Hydnum rufescens UP504]|uniref:FAD-binding domain-containing protein n=1 Tax=Hydnum rufescens UP504 TaxID=1448309 RepID=A0A9P6AE86_9AGAM|nr:hypothetical protein BS47DRAFT_1402118 [Hydnum rufescens UP504]
MATRFRKIYGGRELAFELLGSVFCYSRSSAGQDFAHSSLLGENDASSSGYIAVPCILWPVLVHSRGHAYPHVISGSTVDRPAQHSIADLGCRPDTNPSTHAPHSLILLYEEYRSVRVLQHLHPHMSSPQGLIVGRPTGKHLMCGLVAPLVLCKNGIPVRPIEKALDYQIGVRGNGIQPRILELIKILGLVAVIFDNTQFSTFVPPHPRILGQCTAEAMLRSHLSRLGVTVELGTGLVDFTQDAHKVTTNLLKHEHSGSSQNETLEVDCVTRKHLGISFWGEMREKLPFLVADVDMERLDLLGPHMDPRLVLPFPWVQLLTPQWWVMGLRNKYKMSSKYYVGLEASLVMKNLSPRSLLSTYETERMPPIKEMLKLVTNLHTPLWDPTRGMTSEDTSQSVYPGFVHDHVFEQLGVNYECSKIVLDRRFDRKNVNKVYMPGRRAPDAPNLVLGPVVAEDGAGPTTMTLFDRLRPFSHTALVFKLPEGPPAEPPSLHQRRTSCMRSEIQQRWSSPRRFAPCSSENTPDAGSGRVIRYESGARRYSRSRPEGI